MNLHTQGGAGPKSTNAILGDIKKGECVGMGGPFMFWYDVSEMNAEVLYPLAGYTLRRISRCQRESGVPKGGNKNCAVKDIETLTHLICQKKA